MQAAALEMAADDHECQQVINMGELVHVCALNELPEEERATYAAPAPASAVYAMDESLFEKLVGALPTIQLPGLKAQMKAFIEKKKKKKKAL